ncbi:SDR family oxidoreductase [Phenylobacterium sp.]|uniref:SDR family oxidoreductase n=1 Tax=Phenylobacterium sp. TaxID=1871053 RepID=UPI00286C7ED6|nr:SDR family oxidoreductase [Phenylobacterium sp.]
MERSANPPLAARLVGGDDDLASAISQALVADGARIVDGPANDHPGGLDILIFIAPEGAGGPIAKTTGADFSSQVGASLLAAFLALQSGVSAMRAKGDGGSVVFVAPPARTRRAFDALTQGLRLVTKAAALELGPEKIRVNIVLPGNGENPLGRPRAPAEIAAAVAFAASGRSQFMTGADLVLDGGAQAQ